MQDSVVVTTPTSTQENAPKEASSIASTDTSPSNQAPVEQEAVKEEDNISKRFSILTKRERKILEEKQALKSEREALLKKEQEFKEFESDPYSFLEKKGITYDGWTKKILGSDESSPQSEIKTLRDQIEQLRSEREEEKKQAHLKNAEKEWNGYKSQIQSIVDSKEDYEFLKNEGQNGIDTVLEYMVEFNSKFGKPPTYEEACSAIESHLEKQAEGIVKLKKFQKFSDRKEAAGSTEPNKSQSGQQAQRPTTLTNQMSSQGHKPLETKRKLTREESLAEAAKLIRFID